tara:strand:+ start:10318 stop:10953 length:636 start_codon:yes stop_codon:yes gene_type:complete
MSNKRFNIGTVERFALRLDERCQDAGVGTKAGVHSVIIDALAKVSSDSDTVDYTYDRLMDIEVVSNSRPKRRAGQASFYENELELHGELFKEGRTQDLYNTFIHELAHFIDYRIFGESGHGKTWKASMRALGANPARCHTLEYLSGRETRYVYGCISCGAKFNRHRKLKDVSNRYHPACRNKASHGRVELLLDRQAPRRRVGREVIVDRAA